MQEQQIPVGDGWICHTPDPNNYCDPSQLSSATMNGRPLSSMLGNRRGIVIPRATVAGGSRNKECLKKGKVRIDPGVEGELPLIVDLSLVTEDAVNEALRDSVDSSNDMRELGYRTFVKLAGSAVNESSTRNINKPVITRSDDSIMSTIPSAPLPLSIPPVKPKPSPKHSLKSQIEEAATVKPEQGKPKVNKDTVSFVAPTVRVTFELEGYGTIETSYHDVVKGIDGITLVLIYDKRYTQGTKYFPPASDRPVFVNVHDWEEICKAQATGLSYVVNGFEHYLLFIEKAVAKSNTINEEDYDG